jgi:hypothetical protein
MSIDGSLIHDGGLTTSFANYYNPVNTTLAGPGNTGQYLAMVLQGMTTNPFGTQRVSQIQVNQGGFMIGVLQNTPQTFDPCDIGIMGISKAVAGAALTIGTELMVDSSGRFIPWLAGPSNLLAAATWTTGVAAITMAAANPGSVTAGMSVVDNTNGFVIGTVASYISTTLTLNANAAHASTGAADSLTFKNFKCGMAYETAAAAGVIFSMLIYSPNT